MNTSKEKERSDSPKLNDNTNNIKIIIKKSNQNYIDTNNNIQKNRNNTEISNNIKINQEISIKKKYKKDLKNRVSKSLPKFIVLKIEKNEIADINTIEEEKEKEYILLNAIPIKSESKINSFCKAFFISSF